MTHTETKIQPYIAPGRRVHLAGIGGVSMSPLAEVLHGMGLLVQGSDQADSAAVARLRSLGIAVHVGHEASDIDGAEFVVRTAAIHDDNPEIAAARALGIPVFERAEAWGAIMRQYENALCIAGTHGKTTTTSMATHIFMAAQADPTVMIGGTLPMLHSGYRVGGGQTIILESCEYCNSFLSFFPTVAVILNIEEDHLDFFKDLEDIKASFRRFAQLTPPEGRVVANADDKNTMDALAGLPSILYAMAGVILFCSALGLQKTLLAGALTLAVMNLPTVIRSTQESLRAVPRSCREGALGLGSGRWHMVRTLVLPASAGGIATGCMLAVGRGAGESAVLLYTAGLSTAMQDFSTIQGLLRASGATLTVALYVYAKERADFAIAFTIATLLLILTGLINLAAHLAGRLLRRG